MNLIHMILRNQNKQFTDLIGRVWVHQVIFGQHFLIGTTKHTPTFQIEHLEGVNIAGFKVKE